MKSMESYVRIPCMAVKSTQSYCRHLCCDWQYMNINQSKLILYLDLTPLPLLTFPYPLCRCSGGSVELQVWFCLPVFPENCPSSMRTAMLKRWSCSSAPVCPLTAVDRRQYDDHTLFDDGAPSHYGCHTDVNMVSAPP